METFMKNGHIDYKIIKSEFLNKVIKLLEELNNIIEIAENNSSIYKNISQLEGLDEDKII